MSKAPFEMRMEMDRDQLPLWWLMKAADMPRHELTPLLRELGLPVTFDPASGEVYSSRSEFRQLLLDVAVAEKEAAR